MLIKLKRNEIKTLRSIGDMNFLKFHFEQGNGKWGIVDVTSKIEFEVKEKFISLKKFYEVKFKTII